MVCISHCFRIVENRLKTDFRGRAIVYWLDFLSHAGAFESTM